MTEKQREELVAAMHEYYLGNSPKEAQRHQAIAHKELCRLFDSDEKLVLELVEMAKGDKDDPRTMWAKDVIMAQQSGYIKTRVLSSPYRHGQDSVDEMFNSCVVEMLESLPRYDLKKGALTTFFDFSIRKALALYGQKQTNKSNSAISRQMTKVSRAITELEHRGVEPTAEALAIHMDLPLSKIEEVLGAITASREEHFVDEAGEEDDLTFSANDRLETALLEQATPGPESEVISNISMDVWAKRMRELLDPEDFEILVTYMHEFFDRDNTSYSQVAKDLGLTAQQVMQSISRSRRILAHDPEILALYPHRSQKAKRTFSSIPAKLDAFEDAIWDDAQAEFEKSEEALEYVGDIEFPFQFPISDDTGDLG